MEFIMADATLVYNGRTPDLHPLGGSQSGLVYLARSLVELGHSVTVYNQCLGKPQAYDGVDYKWLSELRNHKSTTVDAFILNRDVRLHDLYDGPGIRALWIQDDIDQPVVAALKITRLRLQTDYLFCVSEWQRKRIVMAGPWPSERALVMPNGFWEPNFPSEFPEPKGNRLVYASIPPRGLFQLLDIFPHIREQVPDAELHVFSDMGMYQYTPEDNQESCGHIYAKLDQPGVVNRGSVGNRELAKGLSECKILAYPNTFEETSCITAMEAQAAGCVVVTTKLGALPETVGPHGIIVPGSPGTSEYDEVFVDHCVGLLKCENAWRERAKEAKAWIARHDYRKIAPIWVEALERIKSTGRKKCLI
jgi:glycosyltransferase involved in cell wall biosynthesis